MEVSRLAPYTEEELDYARECVAIMIHDAGLTHDEARKEVEKMIEKKRRHD